MKTFLLKRTFATLTSLCLLLLLAAGSEATGDDAQTAPATGSTTAPVPAAQTQPAERYDCDPAARRLLERLEAAGDRYRTLEARIDYTIEDRMTGDSERRTGTIRYDRGDANTPPRFHVGFETLTLGGGRPFQQREQYGFDGRFLTVRKDRLKQMTRYQVVAEGERAEPMKLGEGDFPLPIGQEVEEVLRRFEVDTRPPREADPEETDYLRLAPRQGDPAGGEDAAEQAANFLRMEMWIDRRNDLPVRIRTLDRQKRIKIVEFSEIQTDVEFPEGTFFLPRPSEPGWSYRVERLESGSSVMP